MIIINYFFGLILVFLVLSVIALSMISIPYQGVIALMGVSFFCCVFIVALGRTFAALVMYIVYLGGLVVVFGYCVSVEKDSVIFKINVVKYFVVFVFVLFAILWLLVGGFSGLVVYTN